MEKIKELSKKFNQEGEKFCKIGLIVNQKCFFIMINLKMQF